MDNIIKALSTNFDLLDFLYVHYKIPNKKDDNFFFNAKYIANKEDVDLDYIKLHPNEFNWETLCYNYYTPWLEDLIETHYDKIDWFLISKNPKIIWDERLLIKYWDNIKLGTVICHSTIFWDEKLVKFILSKTEEESTKVFWIEKLSVIDNITWSLKMILNFPKSHWIKEVFKAKTLEFSFEDLKKYKEQLNKDIFKYLQVSANLLWTNETIIEFKELLNFKILSKSENVDWSNNIISNFENFLDFKELSKNQTILFDDLIIKKYAIQWDFESLSTNLGIKWNLGLIKTFIDKLDLNKVLRFSIEGVNKDFIYEYRNYIDWGEGCNNYTYNPASIAGYDHIPISIQTLNEKATNWEVGKFVKPYWSERCYELGEWHRYSSNEFLTVDHLETFVEKLSWDIISSNEFVAITNQLLLKFSDKWNWSVVLNRNDFKLEHFYVIHQYLDFEFLSANSQKIFELLEPDKNEIFNHIEGKVDNIHNFSYSLRGRCFKVDKEYSDHYKLLNQTNQAFMVIQCEKSTCELSEINNEKDIVDRKRYYYRLHYWLHTNFELFDMISYVSDSLERCLNFYHLKEIKLFFRLYCKSQEDFKKNYFDVYK